MKLGKNTKSNTILPTQTLKNRLLLKFIFIFVIALQLCGCGKSAQNGEFIETSNSIKTTDETTLVVSSAIASTDITSLEVIFSSLCRGRKTFC